MSNYLKKKFKRNKYYKEENMKGVQYLNPISAGVLENQDMLGGRVI